MTEVLDDNVRLFILVVELWDDFLPSNQLIMKVQKIICNYIRLVLNLRFTTKDLKTSR